MFSKYLEGGYQPLPIGYLTKYPCVLKDGKWVGFSRLGDLANSPVTEKDTLEWDTWIPQGAGVGIALGDYSGVIALDFDSDDKVTDAIKALLPNPPVCKIGKKGVTAFFKHNGEKNKKWKVKGDKDYVLEILSTGNQTVIPPSFHPATQKPYIWVGEVGLLDVKKEDLPSLPKNFYEDVDKITGNSIVEVAPSLFIPENLETSHDDIEKALNFIDPNCGYEEWVEIGMALKSELGNSGLHVWDNWSRKGSKYPKGSEQKTAKKWQSFVNSGINIETLFYRAIENGYKPENTTPLVDYKIPFMEKFKIEPAESGAKERVEEGFPVHLCKNAPNLIGDIQKWIEGSAMYPQPILALCASISLVGVLYAHKIEGSTGSRSNMLCLSVAPSGSGKEHPRKCVEYLLNATGNIHLMGGDPASSTGLISSLQKGKGKRLIQIDEFGRVLKSMNGKNASQHMAGLPTVIMKMFSSASGTYFGSEYANHDGKMDRKDIAQPCLCIHASTVPEHLFQAMTGTDAIDGFLSRWLIFEEKGYPDMVINKKDMRNIPENILDKVKAIEEINLNAKGNIATLGINPTIIPFTKEADKIAMDFCKSMRDKARRKQEEGDSTYSIWTRTFEHATKLALISHDGDVVDEDVMKWSIEVSTFCSQYICDQAKSHISDNENEKNIKRILELIKKSRNGIAKSEVIKKSQYLTSRERSDILSTLIESEQIEAVSEATKTKPRVKYFFTS